jgi:hypothetical protein
MVLANRRERKGKIRVFYDKLAWHIGVQRFWWPKLGSILCLVFAAWIPIIIRSNIIQIYAVPFLVLKTLLNRFLR